MRFCFSLPKLANDEEILSQIPHTLTNKLPLFEYLKNERKQYLGDNPADRVHTAAHIAPWKMEDRRMETNQSFDHEFFGEPEQVLFNFKNLLFSMRWNTNLG